MLNSEIKIQESTCSKCILCIQVCPSKILTRNSEGHIVPITNTTRHCLQCLQCMASCPTESITVNGFDYDKNLAPLKENTVEFDSFFSFLQSRRSVRNFKNEPVPQEMIDKILLAVKQTPYGVDFRNVEVLAINDRKKIEGALPMMSEFFCWMEKVLKSPVKRHFMKKRISPETYLTTVHHLLPNIETGHYDTQEGKDNITRNAPAMLLFHAHPLAQNHTIDAWIAVTMAHLAAHSLGLGSTILGLPGPAISKTPKLKKYFGIPDDHEVVSALILGFPKHKYKRSIQRNP